MILHSTSPVNGVHRTVTYDAYISIELGATCEDLVIVVAHGQGSNCHDLGDGAEPENLHH